MESFEIHKQGEKIYNIYTNSYKRASFLAKTLFPTDLDVEIVKTKKDEKCSGCKEKIDYKNKCSCWNF